MRWLFIIFIVIPAVEMFTLIEVGEVLGSLPTVFLVFFTAVVGVVMLRSQGLSTLFRVNEKVKGGEIPAEEVVSAALLVFAGIFLLLPGFVTDTLGFLLLVPPLRRALSRYVISRGLFRVNSEFEEGQVYAFFNQTFNERGEPEGEVFEAKRRTGSSEQEYTVEILSLADESDNGSDSDSDTKKDEDKPTSGDQN